MKNSNNGRKQQRYWPMAKLMFMAIVFAATAPVLAHAAGTCTPVAGKDVTFCVPLNIHGLSHRATKVGMECLITNAATKDIAISTVDTVYADVSHGSVVKTVKVSQNIDYTTSISHMPENWECVLRIYCGGHKCTASEGVTSKKGGYQSGKF